MASNVAGLGVTGKLTSGESYTQTAGNLLAKGDINITAKTVDITTVNNTGNQSQVSSDLKMGAFFESAPRLSIYSTM